jgi:hypothetical protein
MPSSSLFYPESEYYITTSGQSAGLGIKHPSEAYDQIFISQTDAGLLMWDALSYDRTGLSFTIASGRRQRSYFRV